MLGLDWEMTGLVAAYAAASAALGITTEDMESIQTESGENLEKE